MAKYGIRVITLEGNDVPENVRKAGYSVCYGVMQGFELKSDILFTQAEVDECIARLEAEFFEEMRAAMNRR